MLHGWWYRSGESSLDRCCSGKGECSGQENSLWITLRTKDGFCKDFTNFYTLLGDGGEKKTMLSAAGVGELHHPASRGSPGTLGLRNTTTLLMLSYTDT